ncbi:thermonuclease family protein [Ciceribacter azotifigens]|uniref:thermonuclease family protein n=1 Tax=Ciceribacter azotifigens TaxID=2069303 RepID=UPI003A8C409E
MTGFRRSLRDGVVGISMLLLALLIVAKLDRKAEEDFSGDLVAVDGDTLSNRQSRARLEGIDAPELSQTCKGRGGEVWRCGAEARRRLAGLLAAPGFLCKGGALDRYDRLLVRCRAGEVDVNALMVREGFAVAYGGYAAEEEAARRDRIGIWSGVFDRPEVWRRANGLDAGEMAPADAGALLFAFLRRLFGIN